MTRLYIAHSIRDNKQFATLREVLQRANYQVWMNDDPRPGADWRVEMDAAIYNASAVIIIVTPASAESVYVTYEWSLALGMGKRIIPVFYQSMRDTTVKIHPRLRTVEGFDVAGFNDMGTFYDFFIRELRRLLANIAPPAPSVPAPSAPAGGNIIHNHQAPAHIAPQDAIPKPALPYNRDVMPQQSGHWLVIRRGPNLNMMYRLEGDVITLGREDTNNIMIQDNEVSRYHLKLVAHGQGYALEDLGSTNGTVLNQSRLQPNRLAPLQAGATIYLGDTIILSYEVV